MAAIDPATKSEEIGQFFKLEGLISIKSAGTTAKALKNTGKRSKLC